LCESIKNTRKTIYLVLFRILQTRPRRMNDLTLDVPWCMPKHELRVCQTFSRYIFSYTISIFDKCSILSNAQMFTMSISTHLELSKISQSAQIRSPKTPCTQWQMYYRHTRTDITHAELEFYHPSIAYRG